MSGIPVESTHNPPSLDCGQPIDQWHARDRSATEVEVTAMMFGLVVGLQPVNCVETGCYRGQTSYAIGRGLVANGRGKLLAIDTDMQYVRLTAGLCDGLPVTALCADARNWKYEAGVDFAFIDTGNPADRMQDLAALIPYLASHAVLVFHDTGTQFGLRKQLVQWADDNRHNLVLLPTPRGVGILTQTRLPWRP